MTPTAILIAVVGDGLLCWLLWRFVTKPWLEAYVRRVAREEMATARRLA